MDAVDPNVEEEIVLDGNKEASKHSFWMLGSFEISPDNTKLAYAEDTTGTPCNCKSEAQNGVLLEDTQHVAL